MPLISWLITSRLGRALAAVGAVLLAVAAIYFRGRADGGDNAREAAEDADHARAEDIRRRVDAARADDAGGDAVDRLRQAGRLRD